MHRPISTMAEGRSLNRQDSSESWLLGFVSVFGYVAAQLAVLGLWAYGVGLGGGAGEPEENDFFDALSFAALLAVPPALLLGFFDGAALASRSFGLRMTSAVLLILFSVFWVFPVGAFAVASDDLFGMTGEVSSRALKVGALVGMEAALAAELTVAGVVWLILKMWRGS